MKKTSYLLAILILIINCSLIFGNANSFKLIDDVVRGAAKIDKNIPLSNIDNLIGCLKKDPKLAQKAEKTLDTILDGSKSLSKDQKMLNLIRHYKIPIDDTTLATIKGLEKSNSEAIILLAKGADDLAKTFPDIAFRSQLIKNGGAETIASIGIYGDKAAKYALKLDEAISSGRVILQKDAKAITVANFGKVLTEKGDAAWNFWEKAIVPHWGKWLAAGGIGLYLTDPDYFHDAAGNITEAGFRQIAVLCGDIVAAGLRGALKGGGESVTKITDSFLKSFSENFYSTICALGIFIFIAAMFFKKLRNYFLSPFRWLNS